MQRKAAIKVPDQMRHLKTDPRHNNLPVPWFVAWLVDADNLPQPDFRVVHPGARETADRKGLCWICGKAVNPANCAMVTGPMCLINRISSEPVSHLVCAQYAAKACPFLSTPRRKRNPKDLPANTIEPGGLHNPRNPGMAVVVALDHRPVADDDSLYHFDDPRAVFCYREGHRIFGRDPAPEFCAGAQILAGEAARNGTEEFSAFMLMTGRALSLLFGADAGRDIDFVNSVWDQILGTDELRAASAALNRSLANLEPDTTMMRAML